MTWWRYLCGRWPAFRCARLKLWPTTPTGQLVRYRLHLEVFWCGVNAYGSCRSNALGELQDGEEHFHLRGVRPGNEGRQPRMDEPAGCRSASPVLLASRTLRVQ